MFKGQKIAVIGGTGTFGNEITRQLLSLKAKQVIIFSRNEAKQVAMRNEFKDDRIKYVIGDIRDYKAVSEALLGVDIVIHAAALKHIDICEKQREEAFKTNIEGTMNVINACIENCVDVCLHISSDKAVYPSCFYGNTKAIAEGLIVSANNRTLNTDFINFRCGNIIGSSGSVIPLFIKQIKENNCVTITDKEMTRYFIPVIDAVRLLLKSIEICDRGETFIPRMSSFFIADVAELLINHFGNKETEIRETGIRQGEKMHEELFSIFENVYMMNDNLMVSLPNIEVKTTDYINYHSLSLDYKLAFWDSELGLKNKNDLKRLFKKAGIFK